MRSAITTCLVLLAALALAACGSETPPEEEVREAAILTAHTEDPKVFCRQLVTQRFVEEVFDGDRKACEKSDVVEENTGKPVITEIAIPEKDDSRATVGMRVEGGKSDGLAGHVLFLDVDGEWKLDRFETDYLRSVFDVSIKKVDEGIVSYDSMKNCMSKQLDAKGEAFLRTLTWESMTDTKLAEEKTISLAEKCPGPLAEAVAEEITGGLLESGKSSPAFVHCAREEFAAFIELLDLGPDLIRGKVDFATIAVLQGLASGIRKNCTDP